MGPPLPVPPTRLPLRARVLDVARRHPRETREPAGTARAGKALSSPPIQTVHPLPNLAAGRTRTARTLRALPGADRSVSTATDRSPEPPRPSVATRDRGSRTLP